MVWTYTYIYIHTYRERERIVFFERNYFFSWLQNAADWFQWSIGKIPWLLNQGPWDQIFMCQYVSSLTERWINSKCERKRLLFNSKSKSSPFQKNIGVCVRSVPTRNSLKKPHLQCHVTLQDHRTGIKCWMNLLNSSIPRLLPIPGLLAFTNQGNYQLGISQLSKLLNVLYPVYQPSLIT